jgi:hypothetical protein
MKNLVKLYSCGFSWYEPARIVKSERKYRDASPDSWFVLGFRVTQEY